MLLRTRHLLRTPKQKHDQADNKQIFGTDALMGSDGDALWMRGWRPSLLRLNQSRPQRRREFHGLDLLFQTLLPLPGLLVHSPFDVRRGRHFPAVLPLSFVPYRLIGIRKNEPSASTPNSI